MRKETIWIIAISFLLFFGVQQYFSHSKPAPVQVPYSQLLDATRDGMVAKVDIPTGLEGNITAKLKDGKEWTTIAPRDGAMINEFIKSKTEINVHNPDEGNMFVNIMVSLLPTIIIVGLMVWMMKKSSGGGGGIFGMTKNPSKKSEKSNVRFADVAGIDEAKAEVSELVDFLKQPEKYTKLGGRSPKGVLLAGGPGTGKTLLARAIAGEAGVPFFTVSGSDFVEMFVGVGAKRVRELFADARKEAPAIIFIDEIDAIGRQRSSNGYGGNQESEQTLNQILVEMDGFETGAGIIVLASTNRPELLDSALLRPGRFDRHVDVPNPDTKGREQILKVHGAKVPLSPDVALQVLAKGTPGFSGADLANLVNEAALSAARNNRRLVEMRDFEAAKDKVMMGPERKTMVMSESERETTAYHEAGHAAVGIVMGSDPVYKVSIVPRGRALGVTMHLPQEDRHCYSKEHFEAEMVMLMGGRAAEEVFVGRRTTGASNDIKRASAIARRMITDWGMSDDLGPVHYGDNEGQGYHKLSEAKQREIDNEIQRKVEWAYRTAVEVMHNYRDSIEKMTQLLLEKETIDRLDVESCFPGDVQERAKKLWDDQPTVKGVVLDKERPSLDDVSHGTVDLGKASPAA